MSTQEVIGEVPSGKPIEIQVTALGTASQGPPGPPGPEGPPGESTVLSQEEQDQLATLLSWTKDNGFQPEAAPAEWPGVPSEPMPGPQGPTGIKGPDGDPGSQGP